MKKTVRRIVSGCGLATLFLGSGTAHAFCTEFDLLGIGVNCEDEGHKRVTGYIAPILRNDIWGAIWTGNYAQDNPFGDFRKDSQRHFESCLFRNSPSVVNNIPMVAPGSIEYINSTYRNAISFLDPADPSPLVAADRFGKLLHTVQDFYSHSNWINLLGLTEPNPAHPADVFDRNVGEWPLIEWLGPVRDDIILGQIPPDGLPAGWSVTHALDSEIPVFMTDEGIPLRGLVVGGNENSACPDARPGETVDSYSHVDFDLGTGVITQVPRTNRLTHGESKVAGVYHLYIPGVTDEYDADRPCHDGYPTSVCIHKDYPGRPDYEQVVKLAAWQTAHEWCRLLNLAKDSQYGYDASSILMTLWAKPRAEGPDPITLGACATPPEVLAGKPGPIEVTIDPQAVTAPPAADSPNLQRHLVFALYTGDFRRSIYRTAATTLDDTSVPMQPVTMCVKPDDKLVATVWGYDDRLDPVELFDPDFNDQDRVLRGTTLVMNGPGFQNGVQGDPANQDLGVDFVVSVGGEDPDADGLSSACGEVYYGTDPQLADTDSDGLSDGAEVNTHGTDPLDSDSDDDGLNDGDEIGYGADPLDSDSDDDGLTDGDEVHTYGSNPADADSDDDGLTDSAEINTHHTDPNDADTDDDLLPDGLEVKYGSNPLNGDTDGDGLTDGKDVEWIKGVVASIPNSAIKPPGAGNRKAMLDLLNDIEALLKRSKKGSVTTALDKLNTLRIRNDGCGAAPDNNDWILDCTIQTEVRSLVDLLIANVRA